MLANFVLWNFRHPVTKLPKDGRIYLPDGGIMEVIGLGSEDFKFFVIAMVDLTDLIELMIGRYTRSFGRRMQM